MAHILPVTKSFNTVKHSRLNCVSLDYSVHDERQSPPLVGARPEYTVGWSESSRAPERGSVSL